MPEWLSGVVGAVVTAVGASVVPWIFAKVREASERLQSELADDALRRLVDIVDDVVLDTGEVLSRSLVDALKDGSITKDELSQALNETYEFAWSLMRNADKRMLAGGLDIEHKDEFRNKLTPRLEAEARRHVRRDM